jgi:DNA recombination protein RmuC
MSTIISLSPYISLILFVVVILLLVLRPKTRTDTTIRLAEIERELKSLRKIFTIPRSRGGLGELLLEQLLQQYLPKSQYELQYRFNNGSRVDAVVKLGEYIVPIDAKFPLESLKLEQNDTKKGASELKRQILKNSKDIADKYIHPQEKTLSFALMYLPSEGLFYRLFSEESGLWEECLRMSVVPVSPSSFFLYLQTVAYGLRGLALPQRVREILDISRQLERDYRQVKQVLDISNTHIQNLQKNWQEVPVQLSKLESSIHRLEGRLK